MNKHRQQGVGLIEVLITAFILAVGLLGLAALQTRSLQYNHGAYLRSQATILAYDIIDRMRINRTVALSGGYDVALSAATVSGTSLAATDVNQWLGLLSATLPGGDGAIDCDASSCTISLQWLERSGSDEALEEGGVASETPVEFVYSTRI